MDSYEDDARMHFSEQERQMYFAEEDTPDMNFSLQVDTSLVEFDELNQIPSKSVICAEPKKMAAQSVSASAFESVIYAEPEKMAGASVSASTFAPHMVPISGQKGFSTSPSVFFKSLGSLAYGEISKDGVEEYCRLKTVTMGKTDDRGNISGWNRMVPLALLNKLWGADIESQQLLPGIPDEVFLEHITTKLTLRDFLNLSLLSKSWRLSKSWQQAIQIRKAQLVIDFHQTKVL